MGGTHGAPDWARRPSPEEHAPYYGLYIGRVPDGDVLARLEHQHAETLSLLEAVPAELETYRYAPDKWSIREGVGHLVDSERTFTYRALCFSRGDRGPLPSMEQEGWVAGSGAAGRELSGLLSEWRAVRAASVHLFGALSSEMLERSGVASGAEVTVRALAWIVVGHELHHRQMFRERYGLAG